MVGYIIFNISGVSAINTQAKTVAMNNSAVTKAFEVVYYAQTIKFSIREDIVLTIQ